MKLIYAPAAVSFVLGASSYIIVRFWVLPIHRYRRRKQAVAVTLSRYPGVRKEAAPAPDLASTLRKQAADLSDAFELEVPHWYRMLLGSREESPVEAARLLMKLANTSNADHVEKQIGRIKKCLKLSS